MLTQITIQNLLLFKREDIRFAPGLNVLTGETGAGKSILLEALGLVLGERGDSALIRSGESQASVAAQFDITDHKALAALLKSLDLPLEDTLILRRSISRDGKSKAYLNDAPISVSALRQVGELLVARHGQHDQRGLLETREHRQLLDRFAGHAKPLAQLAQHYQAWQEAQVRVKALDAAIAEAIREEEFLTHMVHELTELAPEAGEEAKLTEARIQAQQAEKRRAGIEELRELMEGQEPLMNRLIRAEKLAERLALAPLGAALSETSRALDEALVALDKLAGEGAELSAEAMEDRLFALRDAARKYHVLPDGLAAALAEALEKLRTLNHQQEDRAEATRREAATRAEYLKAADSLSVARAVAAKKLVAAVEKELGALKMAATKLQVTQTELPEAQWGEAGRELVQFEVATNAGQAFGPLAKVASGGELSRLLLAMKVVLRETLAATTAIFDEIDSGTGGAVAEAIGLRLRQLSSHQQVLVVTHLPQVAALAAHHLVIEKQTKAGNTQTRVQTLTPAARKEELARMLSGATISAEARLAAEKLLQAS
ncbi:MAG: DNA repair protein RecN [Alphaproteobacteria bacterium]